MPVNRKQNALREYKRSVWRLLRKYGVDPLCKDCTEAAVSRAHRSLLKKVHPDKGGNAEDFRVAHDAKAVLQRVLKEIESPGVSPGMSPPPAPSPPPPAPSPHTARTMKRPAAASAPKLPPKKFATGSPRSPSGTEANVVAMVSESLCEYCGVPHGEAKGYRIRSTGVLLTYNGAMLADDSTWSVFKRWVGDHVSTWGVLYHCCTMELCRRRRRHLHLMLQFRKPVDCLSSRFAFQGILPNARPSWDLWANRAARKILSKAWTEGFSTCGPTRLAPVWIPIAICA